MIRRCTETERGPLVDVSLPPGLCPPACPQEADDVVTLQVAPPAQLQPPPPRPASGGRRAAAVTSSPAGPAPAASGSASASAEWRAPPGAGRPIPVPAGASLPLRLTYRPSLLQAAAARVDVRLLTPALPSPEPLVWTFPVACASEADSGGQSFRLACEARKSTSREVEVVLKGLGRDVGGQGVTFTGRLLLPEAQRAVLAPPVLTVEPLHTAIRSGDEPLRFLLAFSPVKALLATVQLAVERSTGGRWLFDVHLRAVGVEEAERTLVLEAGLSLSASAPLWLYSADLEGAPQPFTAAFSLDTPLAFDVVPASGVLPPPPPSGATTGETPGQGDDDGRSRAEPPPLRVVFTNRWARGRGRREGTDARATARAACRRRARPR